MGSLFSPPKAPAVRQKPLVVTVPSYVPPPPAATPPVTVTPPPAAEEPSPEDVAAARSSAGLLERSRGTFSTVLTGFRGLLNEGASAGARKTLLGE